MRAVLLTMAILLAALNACSSPPQEGAQPPEPAPDRPARALFEEAEALFHAREYQRATDAYQLVAHEAERQGDSRTATRACAMAARCYSIGGNLPQGQLWLDRALERANPGEAEGWSLTRMVAGIFQRERGDREGAEQTFAELVEYCQRHGMLSRAIDAAHHAAIAAKPEDQVTWGRRGLTMAVRAKDERWQAILWNNLGRTLESLGRYEEMLNAYRQARHFHGRTGGERQVLLADWAVGRALRFVGRLAEADQLLVSVLERARSRQEQVPGPGRLEWVGYTLWELGEVAAAADQPSRARQHLTEAVEALAAAGLETAWPEGMEQVRARLESLTDRE